MLDFLVVSSRSLKKGLVEIYPRFVIKKSKDLMIRGGDFYAIWVEERGLWSTDEEDAIRLIDRELDEYKETHQDEFVDSIIVVKYLWDASTGSIDAWHKYCQKQMRDSFVTLDESLVFSNDATTKKDYASKRLNYPLEKGSIEAYDKLISTLYSEEERRKIEWAIGAIVTGDSKHIQKFMVLYGDAGTGKSTILNIIQQLFEGYDCVFDARALGSTSNSFALEAFRSNPLVAVQHDGDLSRLEDNTRLNSVVSHELMTVNEKFKATYPGRFRCFLFMGTNKPVKITDGKSGLIRRLIDVTPTGNKVNPREYKKLVKQVSFELGHIAHHCKEVYLENPGIYDNYIPVSMMGASNDFYNFVISCYHVFKKEDGVTQKAAWEMYNTYCDDAKVAHPMPLRAFKEELKSYFREYDERFSLDDGSRVRSYYSGFRTDRFEQRTEPVKEKTKLKLIAFDYTESIFDNQCSDCLAQYASVDGTPMKKWDDVTTTLAKLDTTKLHYVRVPENHIVIDFDIPDENGNKCFERNLEEASKWPATYAEVSKSGQGIHLHYIYTGDASKLSRIYDDHVEIKVSTGKSSLRRKLSKCNDLPIASISSGLPIKGDSKVANFNSIQNERALRTLLKRNLNKEYHANTKSSVDFIYKILEDAYSNGLNYDVSDMKNEIFAFAANSTNQADYCIKLVNAMKFKSEEPSVDVKDDDVELVFYDVEVFPNLFLVNWKIAGEGNPVVRMINPKSEDIEQLIKFNLVGFNCRKYDNHILYARLMGYDNAALFDLSQRIINKNKQISKQAMLGEAYNLSYADVYDFAAEKKSLKKWEIDLGIHHKELGLPWDKPVPEERWIEVAEYCDNDVIATEAVFNHLKGDWIARQILADLAGMSYNDTTNSLTTRIIFGKERNPSLVYTDLATGEMSDGGKSSVINEFPGYEYVYSEEDKKFHNVYRGVDVGFGGYVYAEPGMYVNVALLDVASMHPNSAINLNAFGKYTNNFKALLDARIAIKHGDYDSARKMFDGRLAKYLNDKDTASALAQALKIAINSVYGLTSASFSNPFRDIRNKNNIIALRGALFMKTLEDEVKAKGYTVCHIKTDSIKIANATPEIIEFVMEFGKKYGYTFEHEATYERMCLVNNAVYIAKYADGKHAGEWTATGAQFAVPYVFKKLFSKEPIEFDDMCETFAVQTALYLDMNERLPDGEHDYQFVGKVGQFCPVKPGIGGEFENGAGELLRVGTDKDGNEKFDSANGAKGYRWLESEVVRTLGNMDIIDRSYYDKLVDDAVETISQFGDFEWFVSDDSTMDIEEIRSKINQRRRQVLIHSIIYYKLNDNLVSDEKWNQWARELVDLQNRYPEIASECFYANDFEGFNASTGFDLPLDDPWANEKALYLLRLRDAERDRKDNPPWTLPCGNDEYATCKKCPEYNKCKIR